MSEVEVIFIDDDPEVIELATSFFDEHWVLLTLESGEYIQSALDQHQNVGVVISDYSMPGMNGLEVLQQVKQQDPTIRRVLMSGNLNMEVVIESVNTNEINKVITKPWDPDKFVNIIKTELAEFKKTITEKQRIKQLETRLAELQHRQKSSNDKILDLMINITEKDQHGRFSQEYVGAVEGMKSLAAVNIELYLDSREVEFFNNAFDHLSDIEVFATQYDQKILLMYLNILRGYVMLYQSQYQKAFLFYKSALSMLRWLSSEYINEELMQYINGFPVLDSHIYALDRGQEVIFSDDLSKLTEDNIRGLLTIDVSSLVSISDRYFSSVKGNQQINYLIAIKDDLNIYDMRVHGKKMKLGLISGFAIALTQFLEEVTSAQGRIETIKHQDAVILFHTYQEIDYLMLASEDDLRYRIGLRQFAYESYELLSSVPTGHYAESTLKKQIDDIARKIFRLN